MSIEPSKKRGGFQSGAAHPKHVSDETIFARLQAAQPGTWEVIGTEIIRRSGYRYVLCRCSATEREKLISVDNLLAGKTQGSRGKTLYCEKGQNIGERYDAIKQRTRNPNCPSYRDYGGRGIELRFSSRRSFIEYVLKELPAESYRGLQIDRVNNDGHYEPGNLRLVDATGNLTNTRRNRPVLYRGIEVVHWHVWHLIVTDVPDFSYGRDWTTKLLRSGLTVDELVERSRTRASAGGTPRYQADTCIVDRYRHENGALEPG
ncbi:hypothetical protein [Enterovirga aerilata]|uniref:hypothetical protein n=1 Tax=Enterovirga aerilata TaxID=2730920 RepID=UPI001FEDF6D0|nr:hypothetical protein [Enterovirga sp. DB1703]